MFGGMFCLRTPTLGGAGVVFGFTVQTKHAGYYKFIFLYVML
jgi:hypothetical protein